MLHVQHIQLLATLMNLKVYILITIFITVGTSVFSQNINDSILKANKVVEIQEFKIDTTGQQILSSLFIVNHKGKITKAFWINPSNSNDTSTIITYKYDNSERTISRIDNYKNGPIFTKEIEHIGDSVIVLSFKNDSLVSKKTIVTTINKGFTIEHIFNEENILVGISKEKYKNGKQLYHYKSTVRPKRQDTRVRVFNDLNLPTESTLTRKTSKKSIKSKWTYSYTKEGLLEKKCLTQTEKKYELNSCYFYKYKRE